jgi:hypothetical protein
MSLEEETRERGTEIGEQVQEEEEQVKDIEEQDIIKQQEQELEWHNHPNADENRSVAPVAIPKIRSLASSLEGAFFDFKNITFMTGKGSKKEKVIVQDVGASVRNGRK